MENEYLKTFGTVTITTEPLDKKVYEQYYLDYLPQQHVKISWDTWSFVEAIWTQQDEDKGQLIILNSSEFGKSIQSYDLTTKQYYEFLLYGAIK